MPRVPEEDTLCPSVGLAPKGLCFRLAGLFERASSQNSIRPFCYFLLAEAIQRSLPLHALQPLESNRHNRGMTECCSHTVPC